MACKPCYSTNNHPTKTPPFPQPPAAPQPPLLPLPVHLQASPQYPSWPAARPIPRAKKPRRATSSPKKPARAAALANGASAPIVGAAPSKKRMAATEQQVEWTMDSLYSVSPSPSSVPMPTSLLVTAGRKVPTARACAVEVAGGGGGGGGVNVGATDELRRLLRL